MAKKIPKKKTIFKIKDLSRDLFEDLTKLEFPHKGKIYVIDFSDELFIGDDIHGEVERVSGVLGYLSSIITLLEEDLEDKKDLKKHLEAKLDYKIRNSGYTGEARIDKKIKRYTSWMDACAQINNARQKMEQARGIFYAIKDKFTAMQMRSMDIRNIPGDSIMEHTKEKMIPITGIKKKRQRG